MKVVRWGIVGTGNIASSFAADSKLVETAQLQAVASRSRARARQFADAHEIPTAYENAEEMFADPAVDAIYVATPHNFHARDSMNAMRAGKAVLCEKPLTIDTSEFHQVQQVAAESGSYLVEGLWTYFLPAIKRAHQWLEEGRIGRLCHIRADFGFNVPFEPTKRMYSPSLAGGTLLDMGIYPIAWAWLAMKRSPKSMQVIARHADTGVEDDVTTLCDYGDVTAALTSSMRCALPNSAEWVGSEGRIIVPNFWFASECRLVRDGKTLDHYSEPRSHVGLSYELEAVCRDIISGRRDSEVVPLAYSEGFQEQLAQIRALFEHGR